MDVKDIFFSIFHIECRNKMVFKFEFSEVSSMELFDKLKKNKIEIKPFGKIIKEDISEIEELFDVVLPKDYKKFLLKFLYK